MLGLFCSSDKIVYGSYGTCLERHLEHHYTVLHTNTEKKQQLSSIFYCLQTPGEESIKHNVGLFLSLRLPMGFESPVWRWEALVPKKKKQKKRTWRKKKLQFCFDVWINQPSVSSEQKDLMLPLGCEAIGRFHSPYLNACFEETISTAHNKLRQFGSLSCLRWLCKTILRPRSL